MRETVWIVAETREGAERVARAVLSGLHESYAAALRHHQGLPLPEQQRLRIFDVERTVAQDCVILVAAKAAACAFGLSALALSLGLASIAGAA